jgi:hypothetical protein
MVGQTARFPSTAVTAERTARF